MEMDKETVQEDGIDTDSDYDAYDSDDIGSAHKPQLLETDTKNEYNPPYDKDKCFVCFTYINNLYKYYIN